MIQAFCSMIMDWFEMHSCKTVKTQLLSTTASLHACGPAVSAHPSPIVLPCILHCEHYDSLSNGGSICLLE